MLELRCRRGHVYCFLSGFTFYLVYCCLLFCLFCSRFQVSHIYIVSASCVTELVNPHCQDPSHTQKTYTRYINSIFIEQKLVLFKVPRNSLSKLNPPLPLLCVGDDYCISLLSLLFLLSIALFNISTCLVWSYLVPCVSSLRRTRRGTAGTTTLWTLWRSATGRW